MHIQNNQTVLYTILRVGSARLLWYGWSSHSAVVILKYYSSSIMVEQSTAVA